MEKKEAQAKQTAIHKNDIDESVLWLESQNRTELPDGLVRLLSWLPDLFKDYEQKKRSISKLLSELARSFHQISSSEQVKNIVPQSDMENNPDLERQNLNKSLNKIKKLKKYLSRAENAVVKKIQGLPEIKEEEKREKEVDTKTKKKNDPVEPIFSSPGVIKVDNPDLCVTSEEESTLSSQKGILAEENMRQKNDFIFMRNDSSLRFKTYFDPKSGHKFSPDLSLIGPENYNVTWRGMINAVTLVMSMAMPIARVEKLFGSDGFSRANIIRYMGYCSTALYSVPTRQDKNTLNFINAQHGCIHLYFSSPLDL